VIAADLHLAVTNFIRALDKIPSLIEKYQTDTEKLSKDLPVLQEVVNSVWRKENDLKDLKTELAALDRKIQLSLKPIDQGEDNRPEEANVIDMKEYRHNNPSPFHTPDTPLQQAKEVMGDRLVIASAPMYYTAQPKGIKL
jgi:hypothetical protein